MLRKLFYLPSIFVVTGMVDLNKNLKSRMKVSVKHHCPHTIYFNSEVTLLKIWRQEWKFQRNIIVLTPSILIQRWQQTACRTFHFTDFMYSILHLIYSLCPEQCDHGSLITRDIFLCIQLKIWRQEWKFQWNIIVLTPSILIQRWQQTACRTFHFTDFMYSILHLIFSLCPEQCDHGSLITRDIFSVYKDKTLKARMKVSVKHHCPHTIYFNSEVATNCMSDVSFHRLYVWYFAFNFFFVPRTMWSRQSDNKRYFFCVYS